ncbi:hypothetical protein BDV93DRAFT_529478 [Ceratobasidium sp. AG-I]|nr:hypothetical protein BDV93DRAFT_529478 [Ceratobasidium sp. AG-I]
MTTLVLSRDSPSNTSLTLKNGSLAYVVQTDFKWKDKVTIITRSTGEELARIEWKVFSEEVLTMDGNTIQLSELLRQSKEFTSSDRFFKNSAGEEYRWKLDRKLYCVNVKTEAPVATFYRSSWGIIGSKEPAYIDIAEEVLGDQDLIVVTCLIMENIKRYRETILYTGGGWYLTVKPP